MTGVFLGFTFLIAALFPVGALFKQFATGGLGGPIFAHVSPIASYLILLAVTYLPAALVTAIFFKVSKLKNRLPESSQGQGLMLTGVVLTLGYLLIGLFLSTIQGEGGAPSFIVRFYSPLVLWPARICLAIGVVKALLSAQPSNSPMHPTAESGG